MLLLPAYTRISHSGQPAWEQARYRSGCQRGPQHAKNIQVCLDKVSASESLTLAIVSVLQTSISIAKYTKNKRVQERILARVGDEMMLRTLIVFCVSQYGSLSETF